MTNKDLLLDINQVAQALVCWFDSQGIATSRAVLAMSYLIGTMAATDDKDIASIQRKLDTAQRLMCAQALIAMGKEGEE